MHRDREPYYEAKVQQELEGPQEELQVQQLKLYRSSPFYRLIYRNKERVLGELASLRNSPIFQYLSEVRQEYNRLLILKPQSVEMDIIRGKILIIDEILNMSEAIKNADRVEKQYNYTLENIEKGQEIH
jgi:hypothetical protein